MPFSRLPCCAMRSCVTSKSLEKLGNTLGSALSPVLLENTTIRPSPKVPAYDSSAPRSRVYPEDELGPLSAHRLDSAGVGMR